jgi:hypothetical protein
MDDVDSAYVDAIGDPYVDAVIFAQVKIAKKAPRCRNIRVYHHPKINVRPDVRVDIGNLTEMDKLFFRIICDEIHRQACRDAHVLALIDNCSPEKPKALVTRSLKAAVWVTDTTPISLSHLRSVSQCIFAFSHCGV